MIRIAHIGGWGRNFGDFALQAGQMSILRESAPDDLDFLPIHCQRTRFHPDLIDLINETCDLFLLGGGGMIFHRPEDSSLSGWQFNISLEDLKRIRIPLAVYAIGYNPFHFDSLKLLPQAMGHLRAVQEKAALFSVRNQGSRKALMEGGLDGDRIDVIPDPGLYVPPHAFTLPGKPRAGPKIGLNWAGDRPHFRFAEPWEKSRGNLISAICAAFERVAAQHPDLQVYFLPHLEDRIDSDVWPQFQERLGDRILNLEDAASQIYPPSLAQVGFLADCYRQMDLTIGMRGHANIVPYGMNTPILGLGSHDKVGFFLKEVGLEKAWLSTQQSADAGGGEAIADRIFETLANKASLKAEMATGLAECREISLAFHRRLFDVL
ncbi:polysaccharide pyruvyl transferase family protein [Roseibium limicola]|uniref:Polysaccharide pyruvyl transferase family protein n=1 Tax=Roseibium limicola TaxID=2816037 RepID=A0A939EPT2_9HYPH|nr:polysaccharide pyruvyl transferase family protein [Roseibium limicola]MBO0346095.1 polysaccharide pyruvyl transferase family protein [Roseibium limicola]